MRVSLRNYSDSSQPAGGCFVTSLEASKFDADLPFELPGGITWDSTRAEIEAAYGTPDDTEESTTFDYISYGNAYGDPYAEITFTFHKEEGEALWIMEMDRDPKEFPY